MNRAFFLGLVISSLALSACQLATKARFESSGQTSSQDENSDETPVEVQEIAAIIQDQVRKDPNIPEDEKERTTQESAGVVAQMISFFSQSMNRHKEETTPQSTADTSTKTFLNGAFSMSAGAIKSASIFPVSHFRKGMKNRYYSHFSGTGLTFGIGMGLGSITVVSGLPWDDFEGENPNHVKLRGAAAYVEPSGVLDWISVMTGVAAPLVSIPKFFPDLGFSIYRGSYTGNDGHEHTVTILNIASEAFWSPVMPVSLEMRTLLFQNYFKPAEGGNGTLSGLRGVISTATSWLPFGEKFCPEATRVSCNPGLGETTDGKPIVSENTPPSESVELENVPTGENTESEVGDEEAQTTQSPAADPFAQASPQ